jgi:GT2 family glycosyltransferase
MPTGACLETVSFASVGTVELEVGQPLQLRSPLGRSLDDYRRVRALVRLHGRPLGLVDVDLAPGRRDGDALAAQVWTALRREIDDHLRDDGLPRAQTLREEGLAGPARPACRQRRARLLAEAPFASVIVATHERPDSLKLCLDALEALEYPAFELIVVDNAPQTEATARLVASARRSSDRIRYTREPLAGLAAAHNRGLAAASGEVVAFTDDDVVVDPLWLAELVAAFRTDETVACVTGLIAAAELDTQEQVWQEECWRFDKGFERRVFGLDSDPRGSPLHPYAAGGFGSGANMAFRTRVLRELGGFDPALGAGGPALGGDDLAAFFEILAAGYRLVYEPAAVVYHRHRRDYAALRAQAYGYGVGLTAYLTRLLVERPQRLAGFARRAPRGLAHALDGRSPKNAGKRQAYPRELTWLERRGMVYGPFAYVRGRWERRALYR